MLAYDIEQIPIATEVVKRSQHPLDPNLTVPAACSLG
jgi:hypothetical protein